MTLLTKEMQKALQADGEKLKQMTGEDHGPVFIGSRVEENLPLTALSDPVTHYAGPAAEGFPDPGWYFYDESWCNAHGPYETEPEVRAALQAYIEECLGC